MWSPISMRILAHRITISTTRFGSSGNLVNGTPETTAATATATATTTTTITITIQLQYNYNLSVFYLQVSITSGESYSSTPIQCGKKSPTLWQSFWCPWRFPTISAMLIRLKRSLSPSGVSFDSACPATGSIKNKNHEELKASWNRATPKASLLMGFSTTNHPFGGTPNSGNPHMNACPLRGTSHRRSLKRAA